MVRTAAPYSYHLPRGAFRGLALCVGGLDVSSRASAFARIFGIIVLSRDLTLGSAHVEQRYAFIDLPMPTGAA